MSRWPNPCSTAVGGRSLPAEGPLSGRTIAVTRATDRAGPLVERLQALGATVVAVPMIETVDPSDGGAALRAAVGRLETYDWVVLASRVAAARFLACQPRLTGVKIAAVGPGTAATLPRVDLVPTRTDADGLVEAFPLGPGRLLLPRAAEGRATLVEGLVAKGWTVDAVEAYRTEAIADPLGRLSAIDRRVMDKVDAITFLSPSAVCAWTGAVPSTVVCMGPATAEAATQRGYRIAATADPSTLDGLIAAIVRVCGVG